MVDGDTIVVRSTATTRTCATSAIDTPETVKPGTPVAVLRAAGERCNHRLVEGAAVRLVFDRERRDDYGRLLAYVYARTATSSTRRWSARGYARTLAIAPNTAHAAALRPARSAGAGQPAAGSGALLSHAQAAEVPKGIT